MQPNALYYGDCLDWTGQWDDQTVDLIYLDPPFNSQATYNMLYGPAAGGAQFRAFTDTWAWDADAAERTARFEAAIARPAHAAIVGLQRILGPSGMLAYLTYMAERLEHCHRLLRATGSLYLHCDPTASHYLKIVLDAIFGSENFRNEVVWRRTAAKGNTRIRFARNHDIILSYAASADATIAPFVPYDMEKSRQGHVGAVPARGRRRAAIPAHLVGQPESKPSQFDVRIPRSDPRLAVDPRAHGIRVSGRTCGADAAWQRAAV